MSSIAGSPGSGSCSTTTRSFDDAFVARDRFYRHYLPAYEARHNTNITFQLAPDVVCGLALELEARRGPLDADERDLARRLARHLEEALYAHERVRRAAAHALAGHELLRAFVYPMWLIDVERYITLENDAALAERQRDVHLRAGGQRLVLTGDRADRSLALHLQRLTGAGHGARALIACRAANARAPRCA